MSAPIVDPVVPYTGYIPGGLQPGKMVRIQGTVPMHGQRFDVNLQSGPTGEMGNEDVAFHASVRLNQGYVARNSFQAGEWQQELGDGVLPIHPGQRFEILVLCDSYEYKMAVNGQHFCGFPMRVPYNRVTYLKIEGDVQIHLISWEGSAPSAPPPGPGGPPYAAAPPYGGPQQPGYAPPPYGQPAPGQPEGDGESGFDQVLGSAKSMVTDALVAAATDKLLHGITSSVTNKEEPAKAGGFNFHDAQYGQYPPNSEANSGGGVSSFLTSLAGQMLQQPTKTSTQAPMPNPTPQSNESEGLMSSLLSSLASEVLHPSTPKQQNFPPQPPPSFSNPPPQTQESGGFMNTILTSLADEVLHPSAPKQPVVNNPQPPINNSQGNQSSNLVGSLLTSLADEVLHPSNPKGGRY